MNADSHTIGELIRNRDLVRIERAQIDTRTLQAFPLAFSETLLALLYVYDFHIDGLLFLRRDTITDISVNATAKFQRQLLKEAGCIPDELFCMPHRIESFASLLAGLPPNEITILEEETLDQSGFWNGRYVWREDQTHWMHEFTGAGNWDDELTQIDLDVVTCCQLDTNYFAHGGWLDELARLTLSAFRVDASVCATVSSSTYECGDEAIGLTGRTVSVVLPSRSSPSIHARSFATD